MLFCCQKDFRLQLAAGSMLQHITLKLSMPESILAVLCYSNSFASPKLFHVFAANVSSLLTPIKGTFHTLKKEYGESIKRASDS